MYDDDVITWDEYYKAELLLLPMIVKYCKNNSLSLYIAASFKNSMDFEKIDWITVNLMLMCVHPSNS